MEKFVKQDVVAEIRVVLLDRRRPEGRAAAVGAAQEQPCQAGGEFALFRTDRQLSALQTAAQMLGKLNEKKSLVYFASGLRLNGVNNRAQLQSTINSAIRSNVSMYPIDARGLVAAAPFARGAAKRRM